MLSLYVSLVVFQLGACITVHQLKARGPHLSVRGPGAPVARAPCLLVRGPGAPWLSVRDPGAPVCQLQARGPLVVG